MFYIWNWYYIKNVYQKLNNKVKKIERLENIATGILLSTIILSGVSAFALFIKAVIDNKPFLLLMRLATSSFILVMGVTISALVWSQKVDAKVSLANKLEDYIVGSECEEIHYPTLSEMGEDHILSRQQEVLSTVKNPDSSKVDNDNVLMFLNRSVVKLTTCTI